MKKFTYIIATLFVMAVFSNKLYATYILQSDETWSSPQTKNEDIVVPNGLTLTITSIISFSTNSSITVEVGGRLFVDGGTLTCINSFELWKGIVVLGNKSILQNRPSRTQGDVVLSNGAVIENAVCGVSLGLKNNSGNCCFFNGGGTIIAEDAIFRNNQESVQFNEYVYCNPNNNYAEASNWSSFKNCSFIVNANALNINQFYCQFMVLLYGVKNISFKGCSFNNEIGGVHTYGIYSNNSSILMNYGYVGYPNEYSPYYPQVCTFEGLDVGIFLDNSGIRQSIIQNALFTNTTIGVIVRTTENLRLESSVFNIKDAGVLVYESTSFTIENNTFQTMVEGHGVGIYFDGEVDDNNLIRYNDFINMCAANMVVDIYSNFADEYSYAKGLQFRCNRFSNNYVDVTVPISGRIRLLQGTMFDGAGNDFNNATTSDINLHNYFANRIITYYCELSEAYESPQVIIGNLIVQNAPSVSCIGAGVRGFDYYPNPNVVDPSKINEYENRFNGLSNDLATGIAEYNIKYNQSINWTEYYNGDISYEQQVQDYTQLTILKETMDSICKEVINILFQLQDFDIETYKIWVSRVESPQMDFQLSECYLSQNNVTAMNNVLDNMLTKYLNYNSEDILEYKICLNYLAQWNINNSDSVIISQNAIDSLWNIANGYGASSLIAKAILVQLCLIDPDYNYSYYCPMIDEIEPESNINLNDVSINNIENKSFNLTILPNPTNDKITINTNNDVIIVELIMYDICGKKMFTEKVNNSVSNVDISILSKGVYFISCTLSDGQSITRKIIKN